MWTCWQLIVYCVVTLFISGIILTLCKIYIKKDKTKDLVLKISAILTVIIHYSILYVDYFRYGTTAVGIEGLMLVYPCHISMWVLVIVAFMRNKKGRLFSLLAEPVFYIGLVGGFLGELLNVVYMENPNFLDYGVLKGLLSHSVMIFGCLWLLVGGYIKIRVKNVFNLLFGFLVLLLDGYLVIWSHRLNGMTPPNTMFLLELPVPEWPWLNTYTIGLASLLVCFIITSVYEQIALKKEERWYSKIKDEWTIKQIKDEEEE